MAAPTLQLTNTETSLSRHTRQKPSGRPRERGVPLSLVGFNWRVCFRRFFREAFGILAEDYLVRPEFCLSVCVSQLSPSSLSLSLSQLAMCGHPMREISNPGASGSLFYLSADDAFIIKTVQKKEAHFLQKLLPGYYLVSDGGREEGGGGGVTVVFLFRT